MIRSILTFAATASLAVAPVAAQAVPDRTSAPVAADGEQLSGANTFLYPLAVVILLTIGVILLVDDTGDVSSSP